MEKIKKYLIENFEQVFVLFILLSVATIFYFIPFKLSFLNLYFIPILLAAYYLDTRKTILGAFFCVMLVCIYFYYYPSALGLNISFFNSLMHIVVWGSFLILTGAVVSILKEQLQDEIYKKKKLIDELTENKATLNQLTREMQAYADNIDQKVIKRTEHLEKAKQTIEQLKEKVEDALYNTMDATVAKLIIEDRLRTEKRIISVMFVDLKGFTKYSEERRPEVVVTELNRFLGEMEGILLSYYAHIDKYIGDAIMAEFGAPVDLERHALIAVIAGLKMQEKNKRSGFPWKMRVGISTGETIIGLVGQKRQTYTALGDVVNLADRIQEICIPGTVTIDDATFQEVKLFVNAKPKIVKPFTGIEDPNLAGEIAKNIELLDKNPNDMNLIKKVGLLFIKGNDPTNAYDYILKALAVNPDDAELKLVFAELSLKLEQSKAVSVRGKKTKCYLYEVTSIKDPLMNREKIPQSLFDAYSDQTRNIIDYPEDIILPIESIDGTVGHSKVVGFLSFAIADVLDLTDQEKKDILLAGYLVDIGKIIIPHHLLNRAGPLTKNEFEEVNKHCREGVRILKNFGYQNERMFEIITSHHEHFNGSGYPAKLSGEDIPIGARIVSVADVYDAMTSWRPYRDHWDTHAAFCQMETDASNGKLDPTVLNALAKLLDIKKEVAFSVTY